MTVLWWDRRAFYEVVEELSFAIWWSIEVLLVSSHIVIYYPKMVTWQWLIAIAIIFMYLWYHAAIEFQIWLHEIYVVAHDSSTGDGQVYKFFPPIRNKSKFWQIWNRYEIHEPITQMSPSPLEDDWWWYRFWGWLTGEKMTRINLKGINGMFLEGRRISPNIIKAIKQVRSYKSPKSMPRSGELASVYELNYAKSQGLLSLEEAREFFRTIATRHVYGGDQL